MFGKHGFEIFYESSNPNFSGVTYLNTLSAFLYKKLHGTSDLLTLLPSAGSEGTSPSKQPEREFPNLR